jgi:uncharacterized protein YbcC (UPF0753/DUF2309 family)
MTVVIDASCTAIARVQAKHATVKQLVDNAWLHLWRFDAPQVQRYAVGAWQTTEWGVA